jgi:hypothetical protein
MRWGIQYSYLTKTGWSGAGGLAAECRYFTQGCGQHALHFTSFRYYLPWSRSGNCSPSLPWGRAGAVPHWAAPFFLTDLLALG